MRQRVNRAFARGIAVLSESGEGAMETKRWPVEIRLSRDRKTLTVSFEDSSVFALAAEYLRVSSPSAEVQGHGPSERKTIGGKINVTILAVEPVGRYAVKLVFDDMHDTGIYTWDYLYDLGRAHAEKWAGYLADLDAKGLTREAPPRKTPLP
jgi:DUF971 family protein